MLEKVHESHDLSDNGWPLFVLDTPGVERKRDPASILNEVDRAI